MTDEEHLLSLINKIATEQKFDKFDVKITPVSTHGANYTSNLYRVTVSGQGRDDLQLFAKVAVMNEKVRNQADIQLYDNERVVYTTLMKTYRNLEEKHGVPEENRLRFPKYYGADSAHQHETIVLEDLNSRGFQSANRFQSVDWPYAAAAITELAKFHALSIAYEHDSPSEFDKIPTIFRSGMMAKSEDSEKFFSRTVNSALESVREENKAKLEKYIEQHENLYDYFVGMLSPLRRAVLTHVDFRPSNMLHRVIDDSTTEVIPVDYQTIQLGSPALDVINFVITATDAEFRAKHYQRLVDHYYSELGAALARFGLDVKKEYCREDFDFELKEKLPYGLVSTLLILPFLTLPEAEAPKLDNLDMFSFTTDTSSNDVYSQRLNDIIDDYVKWGVL